MISVGMIFQYDVEEGKGQVMFSDAEKREFSSENWVDSVNTPNVGQKVFFDNSNGKTELKMADEEEQITPSPQDDNTSQNSDSEFDNLDDYISHYMGIGFKLAKDMTTDGTRTITLRKYTVEEFAEITVKQDAAGIHETRMLNGVTI